MVLLPSQRPFDRRLLLSTNCTQHYHVIAVKISVQQRLCDGPIGTAYKAQPLVGGTLAIMRRSLERNKHILAECFEERMCFTDGNAAIALHAACEF